MASKKKKKVGVSTPADERVDAGLVEEDYELQPREEADAEGLLHDFDALDEAAGFAERVGAPHASVIQTNPSEFQNPYVSEEEQGMEMRPTIVGPPAYGSPDPLSSAGRLLPLEQHPLRADALPEGHPAAISDDYGEGYDHTLKGSATVQSQPLHAASDLERHSVGDFSKEEVASKNADVDATEGARELAEEEGVDMSEIDGTGEDGRVTKDDVKNYLADRDNA